MLWGVDDASHAVIGTDFNPEAHKTHGQVLQLWLANSLQPSIAFSFRVIDHPEGGSFCSKSRRPPGRRSRSTALPTFASAAPRPS